MFFTIITNISQEKTNYKITKKNYKNFYKEFFKKVKKKIEVSYEIVDVFKLDKCSKPTFCSKVAQKGKICPRLLEPQKVVPNTKSCSKVAEHNQERRDCEQSTYPSLTSHVLLFNPYPEPFTPYPLLLILTPAMQESQPPDFRRRLFKPWIALSSR